VDVRGVAHVTGGGIPGNLPRALPDDVGWWLDRSTWEVPAVFGRIQELGDVSDEEMDKVFNLGIGMIVVVRPEDGGRTVDLLNAAGHAARAIGEVTTP
jgi:phosphoribosylformylglycinamidine cyclo-ligase